jgi:hypothetical protein
MMNEWSLFEYILCITHHRKRVLFINVLGPGGEFVLGKVFDGITEL